MCKKIIWTRIDPLLHGFQYLSEDDVIFYHLEYSTGGYQKSPANQWVSNYKKGIEHRNEKQWYYKEKAINDFADLIINTPIGGNCIFLAVPPSKRRDSALFDSRNEDVIKKVKQAAGIPEMLKGFYEFIPFETVPDIVYIVDDVITSGSHYVVWKDLIHQVHPCVEVRGLYLARSVGEA